MIERNLVAFWFVVGRIVDNVCIVISKVVDSSVRDSFVLSRNERSVHAFGSLTVSMVLRMVISLHNIHILQKDTKNRVS